MNSAGSDLQQAAEKVFQGAEEIINQTVDKELEQSSNFFVAVAKAGADKVQSELEKHIEAARQKAKATIMGLKGKILHKFHVLDNVVDSEVDDWNYLTVFQGQGGKSFADEMDKYAKKSLRYWKTEEAAMLTMNRFFVTGIFCCRVSLLSSDGHVAVIQSQICKNCTIPLQQPCAQK